MVLFFCIFSGRGAYALEEISRGIYPLAYQRYDGLPLSTLSFFFPSGAGAEPAGKKGVAALTAAALYSRLPWLGDDSRWILTDYAATDDYIEFFMQCPTYRLSEALDGLAAALSSMPDSEQSELAFRVLKAGLSSGLYPSDDILKYASQVLSDSSYLDAGFDTSPAAVKALDNITKEDSLEYYKKQVCLENLLVSAVTDMDSPTLLGMLDKYLAGALSTGGSRYDIPRRASGILEPELETLREDMSEGICLIAFPGPEYRTREYICLELLDEMLLSERGESMVYAHITRNIGTNMLLFYGKTHTDNSAPVRESIEKNVFGAHTRLSDEKYLDAVKAFLKARNAMRLSVAENFVLDAGLTSMAGEGAAALDGLSAAVDSISYGEIRDAAVKYIDPAKKRGLSIRGSNK